MPVSAATHEFDVEPERLRHPQRDVQLHGRLAALQLADHAAIDTDGVGDLRLLQPHLGAAMA